KAPRRCGGAPSLRAAAGYRGNVQHKYDEAIELADRAVALERDPFYRDLAIAMRFRLECDALQSRSSQEFLIPEEERGSYEELLERGEKLIAELRYPRANATVA